MLPILRNWFGQDDRSCATYSSKVEEVIEHAVKAKGLGAWLTVKTMADIMRLSKQKI